MKHLRPTSGFVVPWYLDTNGTVDIEAVAAYVSRNWTKDP